MIDSAQFAALLHALFEYAGIAAGVALYRRARRQANQPALSSEGTFALIGGLLAGAAVGSKAVFLIDRPDVLQQLLEGAPGWPGQSIVGGLLGGLVGIEFAKAFTGQRQSTGDLMVWPIATGLGIGRMGCFLAGLYDDTYGLPTFLPWGVDFGDGIPRHPTQLYEIAFVIALAAVLQSGRETLDRVPGLRFKLFLASYLLWRFGVDSLKPVFYGYPGGLSGIQWVCVFALLTYAPWVLRSTLLVRKAAAGSQAS